MIRQRKEEEKQALQDQLDGYKKIIDARKEAIDKSESTRDYKQKTSEQKKNIKDIEDELLELQFDTSEEAKARRLQLEADLDKAKKELGETQHDRSIELQKDALDKDYEAFKENIDSKIQVIEEYLKQTGTITQEAMALLESRSDAFYQSLLNWNRMYGTGIDSDITNAWFRASNAMDQYSIEAVDKLGKVQAAAQEVLNVLVSMPTDPYELWQLGIGGNQIGGGGSIPGYHDGGFVEGIPTGGNGEVYAKLMSGEYVSTEGDMNNFVNHTLPKLMSTSGGGNGEIKIDMPITVNGNLDEKVLPKLEKMVTNIMTEAIKKRGIVRNANAYSI